MPFDLSKLDKCKIQDVTADVPVPGLKQLFGDDEEPTVKVRGLDAIGIAQVQEDVNTAQSIQDVIKRLASGQADEISDAVQEVLGRSSDNPKRYLEVLGYVTKGCFDPEISKQQAARIAKIAPNDFYRIGNKVMELSGESRLGEHKGSGKSKKSKEQ